MTLSELCALIPDRSFLDVFLYYEPGRKRIRPYIYPMGKRLLTREEWEEITQLVEAWYRTTTQEQISQYNATMEHLRQQDETPPVETAHKRQRHGFIYVLGGDRYYKIGQSVDVQVRIDQFSPKLPFPAELVHSFQVDDMNTAEKELHEHFADKRANGEWFTLNAADIEWIKAYGRED